MVSERYTVNVSLCFHLAITGRLLSLAVCGVNVPGSVVTNCTLNPFELVTPTTSVTILYPTLIVPFEFPPLLTFLNCTWSPTIKLCGFSVTTVVIPVLALSILFKIRRFLWALTSGISFINSDAPTTPTVLDSCKV